MPMQLYLTINNLRVVRESCLIYSIIVKNIMKEMMKDDIKQAKFEILINLCHFEINVQYHSI